MDKRKIFNELKNLKFIIILSVIVVILSYISTIYTEHLDYSVPAVLGLLIISVVSFLMYMRAVFNDSNSKTSTMLINIAIISFSIFLISSGSILIKYPTSNDASEKWIEENGTEYLQYLYNNDLSYFKQLALEYNSNIFDRKIYVIGEDKRDKPFWDLSRRGHPVNKPTPETINTAKNITSKHNVETNFVKVKENVELIYLDNNTKPTKQLLKKDTTFIAVKPKYPEITDEKYNYTTTEPNIYPDYVLFKVN